MRWRRKRKEMRNPPTVSEQRPTLSMVGVPNTRLSGAESQPLLSVQTRTGNEALERRLWGKFLHLKEIRSDL